MTNPQISASSIPRAAGRKGGSPGAMDHWITTNTIPDMLWASEH